MLKMNSDLEGALKDYIKFFDKKEYFKAHEVLEEAWHPLRVKKDPLANLVKGLINGAIAFEHIKRDRKNVKNKAQRVMVSFDRYKYLSKDNIKYYNLFKEACDKIENLKSSYRIIF